MNVCFTVAWWVIVYQSFGVRSKTIEDLDHEDVDSTDYTNASLYTTSEMRDKVLAEWKGRTNEIQGYFDQLPSEEFKENSEDIKFQHYWETKGLKDIDTNQVFNITPQQYYEPPGPVFTIEVNDSYVPKYRISPSEEERMEKYGTFSSESESEEASSEEVKKKKKKKKKESSESGGEKAKDKKEKKKSTPNMDPKEKRKKKKSKIAEDEKKRKDLVKKTLNGVNHIRANLKKIQEKNIQLKNKNQENIRYQNLLTENQSNHMNRKISLGRKDSFKMKQSGLYPRSSNKPIEVKPNKNKNVNGLIDNDKIENKLEKLERQRKRSRQTINDHPWRPYFGR